MLLYILLPMQNLLASQENKSFFHPNDNLAATANEYALDQQNKGYRDFNEDTTAGLYYLHARYYDSQTRQFLTKDPAGMKNLYGYCTENPIDNEDSTGLSSATILLGILGIAGVITYYRGEATNNKTMKWVGGVTTAISLVGIFGKNGYDKYFASGGVDRSRITEDNSVADVKTNQKNEVSTKDSDEIWGIENKEDAALNMKDEQKRITKHVAERGDSNKYMNVIKNLNACNIAIKKQDKLGCFTIKDILDKHKQINIIRHNKVEILEQLLDNYMNVGEGGIENEGKFKEILRLLELRVLVQIKKIKILNNINDINDNLTRMRLEARK